MADAASCQLFNDDCLVSLKNIPDNSLDSLVTDPPAGISFMQMAFDSDRGGRDHWIAWLQSIAEECLRVLKPGAHGLVWAIPRTSHWTAFALEKAGFEIRDIVTHIFGQGFPKSLNIGLAVDKLSGEPNRGKAVLHIKDAMTERPDRNYDIKGVPYDPKTSEARIWQGWGTALKPASEHWILIRKPLGEKTVAKNVLKHGTGGLNIDASRIGFSSEDDKASAKPQGMATSKQPKDGLAKAAGVDSERTEFEVNQSSLGRFPANLIVDESAVEELGEPSRFFYVAKASKADKGIDNTHPTVKSTKLMSYLITLVTPPGGTVLDPFMGSGSTGVAALRSGFGFIGIEKEAEYFQIAAKRLTGVVLGGETSDA